MPPFLFVRKRWIDMVMFRLTRLAALTLENGIDPDVVPAMSHFDASVSLATIPNSSKFLISAITYFEADRITGAWDTVLSSARVRAERAISAVADALAVATGGGRTVESCHPYFVVAWPTGSLPDCGTDWLVSSLPLLPNVAGEYVNLTTLTSGVHDRLSGASLLSLALSNSNDLGKFVGFCRLFEDAFALSVGQLEKKLSKFLGHHPMGLGYTRNEVRTWLSHRDAASHGDLHVAKKHALESDVQGFIPRMKQAAFDVLLNKDRWHEHGSDRREHWRPNVALGESPGIAVATVGRPVNLRWKMLDPFSNWPIAGDCRADPAGEVVFPSVKAKFPMSIDVRAANGE